MKTTSRKRTQSLKFTKAELAGVPDDFLSQQGIKTGDDEYTLKANITFHYLMVEDNAKLEATRQRMMTAQCNLAREENIPLLQKILVLRDEIAHQLGYASYADYATETRMVKNAATAIDFLENLKTGLQPKFDAELEEFRAVENQGNRRHQRENQCLGLALFRQPAEEDEIQRGRRAVARLFPVSNACWTACSRFTSASSV